jgi:hypothetical protein
MLGGGTERKSLRRPPGPVRGCGDFQGEKMGLTLDGSSSLSPAQWRAKSKAGPIKCLPAHDGGQTPPNHVSPSSGSPSLGVMETLFDIRDDFGRQRHVVGDVEFDYRDLCGRFLRHQRFLKTHTQ